MVAATSKFNNGWIGIACSQTSHVSEAGDCAGESEVIRRMQLAVLMGIGCMRSLFSSSIKDVLVLGPCGTQDLAAWRPYGIGGGSSEACNLTVIVFG